ncbi:MAG: ankyrin repeat domain-containing protein [Thermodesulfobacteriota bacterium]|nr:ankyrin repeat domain-containing protein [Thermodesulfobacteriota bacterium]
MNYGLKNNMIKRKKQVADVARRIAQVVLLLIILVFLSGCLNYTRPTPLNQAAWDNDVAKMDALLDDGAVIDDMGTNPNGVRLATALDTAIVQGNIEATKFILKSGADVNLSRFCCANTPNGEYVFKGSALMLASLIGNVRLTEILLEAEADIEQLSTKDPRTYGFSGYDACYFSSELGHIDVVKLLLKHGADINKKYKNGDKSAYTALARGHIDYLIVLIKNGLAIEPDTEWAHYNAEIAHLAALYSGWWGQMRQW